MRANPGVADAPSGTSAPQFALPRQIYEQTSIAAFFAAPSQEVGKLLPGAELRLVELYAEHTVVGVACTNCRVIDGAPSFMEASIVFPVRVTPAWEVPLLPLVLPRLFKDTGYYIHRSVSSSPALCELGQRVHGIRRVLGELRCEQRPFAYRCSVSQDGKPFLALDVKQPRRMTARKRALSIFAMRDGRILRTTLPLNGALGIGTGTNCAALTLGEHYFADELRALRFSTRPLFTAYGEKLTSALLAPEPLSRAIAA